MSRLNCNLLRAHAAHRPYLITCLAALQLSLFFSSSAQDLTVTWGPEVQLSENYSGGLSPRLAVWDDAVHVVWSSLDHSLRYRAVIRSSFDRGASWRPARNISDRHVMDDVAPVIAAWANELHVVTQHQSLVPYYFGTGYQSSANYGLSWSHPSQTLIEDGAHPAISVWATNINVVGLDGDYVYHRLSPDGGLNFEPQDTLALLGFGGQPLRLLAWQNYVYLVYPALWPPTNQLEIFFQRSDDGGRNFDSVSMLSTEDFFSSQFPALGCNDEGDVYASWYDYKYTSYTMFGDVLMRHSEDFGEHWGDEIQVTFDHKARTNAIAVKDSQVHIVWEAHPTLNLYESELYYSYSDDEAQNWMRPERLTYAHGLSTIPDLIIKNDTLHLVWNEEPAIIYVWYRQAVISSLARETSSIHERSGLPKPLELGFAVYPNPFNANIYFQFQLELTSVVTIRLTNLMGVEVTCLSQGQLESGKHWYTWNGRNNDGEFVATGIYLAVLEVNERVQSVQKIVYIK